MTGTRFSAAAFFVALLALASADPAPAAPYDCSNIDIDGHKYDISAFKPNTYTVTGEPVASHPNKFRSDYTLNPCQAITIPEGQELSHCTAGAWVCQDVMILLEGDKTQTVYLNTIAGSAPASDKTPAREVAPATARADKIDDIKELPWNLTLKGGNVQGKDKSAVITFICDESVTDDKVGPTLSPYSDDAAYYFTWKSKVACPLAIPLPVQQGMSGFGVFMTVLIVLGLIYVIAGAVYNHQVYGAKGLDLLPNLDFWRDVPGLIVDLARQLWESVTGRSSGSHGGYQSV
ncbi:autophagy-related protein 27 [Entomortierella parvispora]|uniref:Autophagy-related protein 27 n=1 Tax=Entomortierella parvispora TaxID=205924 RepID=A0A9P3HHR6_9FUNG|nr:autophagy-related protein 27 [Entomortierella parvispora]